ncbi:hypothetical protein PFICI_09585 [Pestalotiopsis fici W106-1]|uniref:Uncharacterized protein n=1 Tax=Pestalotiopsis fici (strain W106-1 / CGMCC3.15140) TaxID=1229662 RepID=W3X2X5_PESFW|nr:uncharacterized protein PFICI_09585 [Pestalotiopsis fici W106-1]ETS79732.1 hypothetical protein PFICI_09585 [Pestalotiopsis fici W106-1]
MITRFNQSVALLPSLTQEVGALVAQPEKFMHVSEEIIERFRNMGSSGAKQPITSADLDSCITLLREFQELTRAPMEQAGETRALVVRDPKIEKIRGGVNEGMFFVATQALQTSINDTNALDLRNVQAFKMIMKPAQILIEQSNVGMLEDAVARGEDLDSFVDSSLDPAQFINGGRAYRGIDDVDRNPLETQGRGKRFAGQP